MTQSIYPEIRFVGREDELKRFEQILEQHAREKWAILLHGPGGIGKTQLLKKFLQLAREKYSSKEESLVFSEDDIIDLYWTEHRREESLLRSLAYRLDPEGFQEFFAASEDYAHDIVSDEDTVGLERLRDAFLMGYSRLKPGQIILAFDTAERLTESALHFFRGLLHDMHKGKPGTLVLLAGRSEARQKVEEALGDACESWEIGCLDKDDIKGYLVKEGLQGLKEEDLAEIAELTGGKPIRIALVIDWLKEGNSLPELLGDLKDSKHIDRNLVRRVASVQYPQDWLILYMALFSRRFNQEFASILLPDDPEKLKEYLEGMRRFFFVKYSPPSRSQPQGNWQLHDEMRDLLNIHIWPDEDPTGEIRLQVCRKVVEGYYQPQIEQASPDSFILADLKQEWLYYLLQIDFEKAFEKYESLAAEAEKGQERTASYFEALNAELEPYQFRMNERQRRKWKVNQVIAGSFSTEKAATERALQTMDSENWQNWDAVSQAEIRYRLARIYQRSGQMGRLFEVCAFEENQKGEWIHRSESALRKELSPSDHLAILLDYARLLTVVGLAYRSQNHMNHAIACFKEAIRICETVRAEDFEIQKAIALAVANAQNNLGYVYQRMGRTDEALAECQAALEIRERFGNPEQLGYSYNVIGTIRVEQLRPEEAESCFRKARSYFEKANFESGIGLVLVAHGRLLRQWGQYRQIHGEPTEKAKEKYEAAKPMLTQAVEIFRRLGDRPNLTEALNEKGTLLRQVQRWDEAESCYTESLRLAVGLSNQYRQADNECDLGILYFQKWKADGRPEDAEKALEHSERAAKIADEAQTYYIKSKARQTSASIYLEKARQGWAEGYKFAFEAAADAATGILRLSPNRFVESAAKRTLEYERVVRWLREEVIMQLPDQGLVDELVNLLTERWKNEIVEPETGKKLVTEFPGFITAMQSARRDYQLLKNPKTDGKE